MTLALAPARTAWCCPQGHELDGGPVQFWCGTCRRTVFAADARRAVPVPKTAGGCQPTKTHAPARATRPTE